MTESLGGDENGIASEEQKHLWWWWFLVLNHYEIQWFHVAHSSFIIFFMIKAKTYRYKSSNDTTNNPSHFLMQRSFADHCHCCQLRSGLPFTGPKIQQKLWNDYFEESLVNFFDHTKCSSFFIYMQLRLWEIQATEEFLLCTDPVLRTINLLTSFIPQFLYKISIMINPTVQARMLKYRKD